MTRRELIPYVALKILGEKLPDDPTAREAMLRLKALRHDDLKYLYDVMIEEIFTSVVGAGYFYVGRKYGELRRTVRGERWYVHPVTGKRASRPSHFVVEFNASKELKERLKRKERERKDAQREVQAAAVGESGQKGGVR